MRSYSAVPFEVPYGTTEGQTKGDVAFESVLKDDAEALLSYIEEHLYADGEYRDYKHGTSLTLLGLCIMRCATHCMRVLLLHLGADADAVCLTYGVQFLRSAIPMTMTGRKFSKTMQATRETLAMCDLRRAQLRATQWCIANMPAEWRDLAEGILIRLRHA